MVASISARGNVKTALSYYAHLGRDDYYARGEPPGRWAGEGAERLSLADRSRRRNSRPRFRALIPRPAISLPGKADMPRALGRLGHDLQRAQIRLRAVGALRRAWTAVGGTSPSVSGPGRHGHLERTAACAAWQGRRHPGTNRWTSDGPIRSPHQPRVRSATSYPTSCSTSPRAVTGAGVRSSAGSSTGAKNAGAIYRRELANELERRGHRLDRQKDGFRVSGFPARSSAHSRNAPSDRRRRPHVDIEPQGMELAALRTRRPSDAARRPVQELAGGARRWGSS